MLKHYNQWLEKASANISRLTLFDCPACGFEIYTPKPSKREVYDSLTTCPKCSANFFKVVRANGKVEIENLDTAISIARSA